MAFPIIAIIITILIFLLSALPLHFAAKLLGGNTHLLKTAGVALISGIIIAVIQSFFSIWGGLIAFVLLLFIYKGMFDVGWIRAFLIWLIQLVIIIVISLLVGLLEIFSRIITLLKI